MLEIVLVMFVLVMPLLVSLATFAFVVMMIV